MPVAGRLDHYNLRERIIGIIVMIHLQSIGMKTGSIKSAGKKQSDFPFNLPLIKNFDQLEFYSPVTFFIGENGSGKSTLLEAIGGGIKLATVGGDDVEGDVTLEHARALGKQLKFSWLHKTHRGFFLRAEDFFNFARRLQTMMKELREIADSFDAEISKGAVLGQRQALIERYGENLDANSHGESFLKLFQSRFVPGGLYLLDEPEAPLSPQRQLALMSMLKEMVEQEAQFIIATHSPILMAYPGAQILSFDNYPVREVDYDEVEHVCLTRAFLNNPQSFLRRL
jgi:predicted ATPase